MKISQNEARRLRKRVTELETHQETRLRRWSCAYPGGIHIDTIKVTNQEACIVATAVRLGHTIIVKEGSNDELYIYAVKP